MRVESVVIPVVRQILKRPRVADALFRFDSWGNAFSEENNADPYRMLPIMRAEGPVVYKRLFQQWFVTGYAEAHTVLSSSDVVSGKQMEILLDVRPYNKLTHNAVSFLKHFLLTIDPPAHTRLRSLVNRAFTPRQVARLDEWMDDIITDLIDGLDPRRPDLVSGFNTPLPIYVIAQLLGVPAERRDWIRDLAGNITLLLDPFRGFDPQLMNKVFDEFHAYVMEIADERRREPREDLLTGLVQAEQDGDRLSSDELFAIFGLILFAGHETTAGLLGNAVIALARFPEQRAWIREHPEQWPNTVEELVRFDTSVRSDPRTAVRDIELGSTTIPAGANLVVLLVVANRDPRRFEDPDVLKLDRADPSPISFGHGIHYCLGANLARLEIRKGLSRLLDVLGDYTVDTDAVTWKQSITLRGPTYLPITVG